MADDKGVPWQNKTLMVAAVIIAVAVVILNYWYISRVENKQEDQLIPVYRTKRTIEPGRPLQPDDIEEVRVPAPSESDRQPFVRAGERGEYFSIKDTPVRRRIDKGEPVRWDMFTEYGGDRTADQMIRPDYRAIPIDVNPRHSSPLVRPNSKIDLLGTLQLPGPDGNTLPAESRLLLEMVDVLAVGNVWRPEDYRAGASGGTATKLVIHVPKEWEADLISILKLIPPPDVVLRNPTDTSRNAPEMSLPRLQEWRKLAQSQKINPEKNSFFQPQF